MSLRGTGIRDVLMAAAVAFLLGTLSGCGDGGGAAPPPPPPPLVIQQNSIAPGDFNNDGRLDLVVASAVISGTSSLPGQVDLFLQDPSRPGFFSIQGVFTVGIDPFQVAAADLNGDGLPDLAVANANSDSVSVLLNNTLQPGRFFPAVNYPCGLGPLSVAVGDLNDDGLPDLAVAVADGVDILFQNPAVRGTFLQPASLALADGTFSVAVGDLDGDGIPDIAAAGLDAAFVFFQDPLSPGTFFLPEVFVAGLQPNAVAVADIDRDGLLDIAVANVGSSVDGSGASFSVLIQDPLIAGDFLPVRNFATPNGAQNLAVGDLDGDGFPDIAVASTVFDPQSVGVTSVFLQDPAATVVSFRLSQTLPDGFAPLSVAIGDLNADGRPDIAIQDGPSILFQDPLRPGRFFNEVLIGP